jgi:MATE family multidrug resistance protein
MHTTNRPIYQLTHHPIGSLREVWALSWPLMVALFSSTFMVFADRVILAHYSTQAMNSVANAGIAQWGITIFPLCIAETCEVFVGRFHGEGNLKSAARPAWQMLWLSLFWFPFIFIVSRLIAPYIFAGTGNTELESTYFITILGFSPFFLAFMALSGFFIGIGKPKIITAACILGNTINIILALLFVFGFGPIPSMSIQGAAFATGLATMCQFAFLLLLFFRKQNRETYATTNWHLDLPLLWNFLKIATPAGVGRVMEIVSHCLFFRMMLMAGQEVMTCVTMVQSIYILLSFAIDGLTKGVTSIFSNLIGANMRVYITKVIRSAMSIQIMMFCIVFFAISSCSHQIAALFLSEHEYALLQNPSFIAAFQKAALWMTIFFLFDGCSWVLMGLLTSEGKTKFIMFTSLTLNWFVYIVPTYILLNYFSGHGNDAWMTLAICSMLFFTVYAIRTRLLYKQYYSTQTHLAS